MYKKYNVRLKCDFYSANLTVPLFIYSTKYLLGMRQSARDGVKGYI